MKPFEIESQLCPHLVVEGKKCFKLQSCLFISWKIQKHVRVTDFHAFGGRLGHGPKSMWIFLVQASVQDVFLKGLLIVERWEDILS